MSDLTRVILCFVLLCILGVVRAQEPCEEPNVAVIVLASVFGTLAVVFITLGIICFLLWKRRRDLSRPPDTPEKNNLKDNDHGARSPDGGFSNPAFSETDGQGDLGLAEEGAGGYVRCREHITPEKKSSKDGKKDSNKKTWNSLPRGDLPPGPTHNGSIGSLDDHFISADPEVTSVWLQSQDFIGLGFNIAGSMRDGIYISQVHNRGPAVESGKFKIGDRILSVTISFENMVYEDALTILSYASPYPVKVTLQKELTTSKNRKPSDAYSNLSHPLYRSQSVDTISKIGKETTFVPKRSLSLASQNILEDRLKKSPLMTKFSFEKESIRESQEMLKHDTSFSELKVDTNLPISTTVEINTPPEEANKKVEEIFQAEETVNNESAPSVSTLTPPEEFTQGDDGKPPPEPLVPPPPLDFDTTDSTSTTQVSSVAAEYSALFDSLNEQDKLDMLRLSYEDPDDSFNYSHNTVTMETSLTEGESSANTVIDLDPKSPAPIKPERRKKKSSNGSVSSAEPSPRLLPEPDGVDDDVIAPVSMETVQCSPSTDEINEDVIMPESKTRDVSILSKSIEFSVISNNNDCHGGRA
ncbi:hypothetical protein FSP39_005070 [Pinctada imbricata]|uniref:PDZ domain-containing protein n=1 Tax=Pinctada imbricata TaxID=66713 RepID=A0AA89C2Z3_PINIB|nr:hypothetical protein FSP39_005070 [Pinctada imbricata]